MHKDVHAYQKGARPGGEDAAECFKVCQGPKMVVKDTEILYLGFLWLSTLVRGSLVALTPLQGTEDRVVLLGLLSITIYSY